MLETTKTLKFLEHFSIITVSESKVPNFAWKKYQSEKMDSFTFTKRYEYKGGELKQDKTERPKIILVLLLVLRI